MEPVSPAHFPASLLALIERHVMAASDSSTASNSCWLGYLTFVDLPSLGTVGGLLIVDRRARPIEFHCSAPIQPTRTQEILYGKTLRSTLVCDQIGNSLVKQLSHLPKVLLTDEPMALGLRELLDIPIAVFQRGHEDAIPHTSMKRNAKPLDEEEQFEMNGYQFAVSSLATKDSGVVEEVLNQSSANWDWIEPIERIGEAIREAHRAAA